MVRPKSVVCYICGREYGTMSISIHIKACEKKWDIEQAKKPKGERRPCPTAPTNFDDILTGKVSNEKMNEYNDEAFTNWNEKVLEACPNCARTFLPDRLEIHLKSCRGPGGSSPTKVNLKIPDMQAKKNSSREKTKSPAMIVRPKTLVCYICGREYGTKSLEIHIKSCIKKWEIE